MMVMPSNHSSPKIHYWAGRYPGKIGWLIGPTGMPKTKLRPWMPFALDNDAFSAWSKKREWCERTWVVMMRRIQELGMTPLWALVPDAVADRDETLRKWEQYAPIVKSFGWNLAFAVQDGMTPSDLPDECVIFVGGTTEWKWDNLPMWTETGRRVHVGRVNEINKVVWCEALGVESVDGTGWMRGTDEGRQARDLTAWVEGSIESLTIEDVV